MNGNKKGCHRMDITFRFAVCMYALAALVLLYYLLLPPGELLLPPVDPDLPDDGLL